MREASRRPFCLCCGRRDASGSRNAAPVPLGWRPASPGSASKASDSAFQLRYRVFPSKDRPFHRVFTGFLPGFYRVFTGFTDSALKLLLGFPSTGTLLPSFTGFFLGSLTQLSSCWQVSHQRESFYWAVQVFTGFYWVLLGFTGFYWVEKRFLIKGSTSIGIYRVELG